MLNKKTKNIALFILFQILIVFLMEISNIRELLFLLIGFLICFQFGLLSEKGRNWHVGYYQVYFWGRCDFGQALTLNSDLVSVTKENFKN